MRSALAASATNYVTRDNCPHCEAVIQGENLKQMTRDDGIIVFTLACSECRRITHRHFYRGLSGQLIPMTPEEIARDSQEPVNRARVIQADIVKHQVILDELRGQLREVLDELDEQARADLQAPNSERPSSPESGKDFDAPNFIPSGSLDQELADPPAHICKLCGRHNCMAVTMNDHTACDFHGGHA